MEFLSVFLLLLVVGTPIASSVAVLAFLFVCADDRIRLRRGEKAGRDVSGPREQLKRNRKRLLVSGIICVCSWVLLIVLSAMTLANM